MVKELSVSCSSLESGKMEEERSVSRLWFKLLRESLARLGIGYEFEGEVGHKTQFLFEYSSKTPNFEEQS